MAIGLGRLRLSPRQFWAMSLRELTAALHGLGLAAMPSPLARGDLDELRARYPDIPKETDRD